MVPGGRVGGSGFGWVEDCARDRGDMAGELSKGAALSGWRSESWVELSAFALGFRGVCP